MPYKLGERGSYGCAGVPVLVERSPGLWSVEKCHPDEQSARKHLRALQINVMAKEKS